MLAEKVRSDDEAEQIRAIRELHFREDKARARLAEIYEGLKDNPFVLHPLLHTMANYQDLHIVTEAFLVSLKYIDDLTVPLAWVTQTREAIHLVGDAYAQQLDRVLASHPKYRFSDFE